MFSVSFYVLATNVRNVVTTAFRQKGKFSLEKVLNKIEERYPQVKED
jgi:hypothetical protein